MISSIKSIDWSAHRAIVASLAVLFLLTSCGGSKQVRFSSLFKEDDELTANIAFKVVEKTYRIKPDRRYLLALSDISSIVTGKPLDKVEVTFDNGKWRIQSNKKDIAQVNDFASFEEILNSLVKYARFCEGEKGQFPFTEKKVLNHGRVFGELETETNIVYDENNQKIPQDVQGKWGNGQTFSQPEENDTVRTTDNASEKPKKDSQEIAINSDTEAKAAEEKTADQDMPAQSDPIDTYLLQFSPKSLFKAIDLLNARWKDEGGSQQSVDQAATALTCLSFQLTDTAGTADALFSKALAFVALSKRYETANRQRNTVRLAEAMGYHVEALNMARDLPESDPFRIFMLWQARTLMAALDQGFDNSETRYLYLKKLVQEEASEHRNKYFPDQGLLLPVTGLINDALSTRMSGANFDSLKKALFDELDGWKSKSEKTADAEKEPFFVRLSKCFEKLPAWPKDALISQELMLAYYRAFAYQYVLHDLAPANGSRTERDAEKIFDIKYGKPSPTETGNTIHALCHSILDSRTGHYHVAKMLGDAVSAKDLGDYPRFLAFAEASRWFSNGEQKLISAGKTIFENIDSRPQNRFRAAQIAHNDLLHPVLAHDLNKLGFAVDFSSRLSVSAARQDADLELLRKIAETKTRPPSHRAEAIATLCRLAGSSDRGAKNLYVGHLGELLEKCPGNLEVLRLYVETARHAGKTALAIANTKQWISNETNPSIVEAANLLLGTLYSSNGNFDEAVQVLTKKNSNEFPQSVADAYVTALIQKGEKPKAEAFADSYFATNRPSVAALSLQAQMLWAKKKYNDAAVLLKNYPWHLKEEEWRREIYPAFKLSLAGHWQDTAQAVRALAKEGFAEPADIGELAQSFSFFGRSDVGFEVLNTVLSSSFSGHELNFLNLSTMAYTLLQKSENEKIALKWIQEKVPPQFYTPLAMFAFQNAAYSLLWKLVPANPEGVGSEYVWLTRAASMPMQKNLSQAENRLLIQHYSKNDDDALFQIGKCLIGVTDTKTIMEKRINVRELCDLSYFIGSRDAYLGDQTAAAKWYHMALETGVNKASESARNAEAIRRLSQFYPDWTERY